MVPVPVIACNSARQTFTDVADFGFQRRLWERVDVPGLEACWTWQGARTRGYGVMGLTGGRRRGNVLVHVAAYLLLVGPIPEAHQIDHLCGVTACVNPAHLEAVTQAENLRRQAVARKSYTHCKSGRHEYTPENTLWRLGARKCRACERAARARRVASS